MFVDGRIDEVLALELGRGVHIFLEYISISNPWIGNLKNLASCADGVYPYKKQGLRAQRAGLAKTGTDGESVRADRRLRADDEAIRT